MTFVSTSNFCLNVSTHWKIDVKYCNIPQISYSSIVNCCYCDPLRWFHNPSDPTSKANPKRGRAALPAEVDGPPGWDFTPRKHEICTLIPLCVYIYYVYICICILIIVNTKIFYICVCWEMWTIHVHMVFTISEFLVDHIENDWKCRNTSHVYES
jgi:hypothetical protein